MLVKGYSKVTTATGPRDHGSMGPWDHGSTSTRFSRSNSGFEKVTKGLIGGV